MSRTRSKSRSTTRYNSRSRTVTRSRSISRTRVVKTRSSSSSGSDEPVGDRSKDTLSSQPTTRDTRTKRDLSSSDDDSDAHYKRTRNKSGEKGKDKGIVSSTIKKSTTGPKTKAKLGMSTSKQSSEESEKTKKNSENPSVSSNSTLNTLAQTMIAPKPVTFTLMRGTNIKQAVAQLVSDMSYDAQRADPAANPILSKLQDVKFRGEICAFYNVGKCLRPTPHSKNFRNDGERLFIHLCAYCNARFHLAMTHSFEECPFVTFKNHIPKY